MKSLGDNKVSVLTSNGANIVGDYYPNDSNKGIIMLPGFSEPRDLSKTLAEELSKHYKVWSFDLNSQGESTGRWNLEDMISSLKDVQKEVKKHYNLKKLGAHGNSTGGIITGIIASSKENCLDAICLTSTPLDLQGAFDEKYRKWLKRLPQALVKWGAVKAYKWLMQKSGGEQKEDRVVSTRDHLKLGSARIYDIKEAVKSIDAAPKLDDYAENITIPVLFIYGGEDSTSGFVKGKPPERITEMYNKIKSKEKKLIINQGLNHRLYPVPQVKENLPPKYYLVQKDVVEFFKKYLE
ncbi:alpha/beta fold hydrolase [Candidatus Woesearchaeota archaeon]|nr:alpha/beta fold hydrolase [Candidatus Woesearchaeota archaeon]